MDYTTTEQKEFSVIGISVRTSNQNGQSKKDISELWVKFMGGNLMEKIPDKASNDLFCIYTEYETDHTGPYTTILGCKVASLKNIPAGFIGKIIPAARYNRIISKGPLPGCVLNTWREVWESNIERAYGADFDVYGEKAQNPEHGEVETFVSVK